MRSVKRERESRKYNEDFGAVIWSHLRRNDQENTPKF